MLRATLHSSSLDLGSDVNNVNTSFTGKLHSSTWSYPEMKCNLTCQRTTKEVNMQIVQHHRLKE